MHIKVAELLTLSGDTKPTIITILRTVKAAYKADKILTIQTLLYIRDKNNWAGKREFVRTTLLWLKKNHEDTFNRVLRDFLLVWRWDDLFFSQHIVNENIFAIVKGSLEANDTLLKKWLPKERTDPDMARVMARWLGLTMKEYRIAIKHNEWVFVNTLFRAIDSYKVNLPTAND